MKIPKLFLLVLLALSLNSITLSNNALIVKERRLASIISIGNKEQLTIMSPGANPEKYDYLWKFFKEGKAMKPMVHGVEFKTKLPRGNYQLHLDVKNKLNKEILDSTTISIRVN